METLLFISSLRMVSFCDLTSIKKTLAYASVLPPIEKGNYLLSQIIALSKHLAMLNHTPAHSDAQSQYYTSHLQGMDDIDRYYRRG